MDDTLQQLSQILHNRKNQSADQSYVASLYAEGIDRILQKVGEEAVETIIAAKNGDNKQLVSETADLWFHCMVMLAHYDLTAADVLAELASRFGVSGLEEKANR